MVSKADYLNYMQGIPETSGYLTSPLFQEGFEEWDPDAWRNQLAEGYRQEAGTRGVNFLGGISTETPTPGEYPYPDYDPAKWGTEFGHEITHSSIPFQGWSDAFSRYNQFTGNLQSGKEEALARMHDYMYGDISDMSNFLGTEGYINPPDYNKKGYGPYNFYLPAQSYNQRDFTPKAYDLIKNSNLKDWQKGVMSLGPTVSRGQIDRGQTPQQVKAQGEAYMDPDRGNVQAPTMTQQGMRDEAALTGGTVNPHEMTRAAWTPEPPLRGPHARGGIVSL